MAKRKQFRVGDAGHTVFAPQSIKMVVHNVTREEARRVQAAFNVLNMLLDWEHGGTDEDMTFILNEAAAIVAPFDVEGR